MEANPTDESFGRGHHFHVFEFTGQHFPPALIKISFILETLQI
jgi:hypothetical protein